MSKVSMVKESSLAEELPFWEFQQLPYPHVMLVDGSVSAGLRVGQIDIECFDAGQVNALTEMLRSTMNSMAEGIKMQWHLSIDSDFEEMLSAHENVVNTSCPSLLVDLEKVRTQQFRGQALEGNLYRPKLNIYLNLQPKSVKKPGLFSSRSEFQQVSRSQMEDALTELKENLEALQSSLEAVGLSSRPMEKSDLIASIYRYLNPKRSKTEPPPSMSVSQEESLSSEVLNENPWLTVSSPRAELVFGDLIVDLERFTLDSTLHAVITLKTLPEITYE